MPDRALVDGRRERETMKRFVLVTALAASCCISASAQQANLPADDLSPNFKAPAQERDFTKRVEMIPMRDGVKLYTVIVIPKGAKDAPILLDRTPYDAASRAKRSGSSRMVEALPLSDEVFVKAGYIIVYQDVRGKYGSEGPYIMTPPPVNSGYNPSGADDTTDAWDTIDWLVKNVEQSNGRVGMIGSSYEGFTVVMALLHPHPALKVAAPESPMVDGWMGDDWFHYGAYRQINIDYLLGQTTKRDGGVSVPHPNRDEYTGLLDAVTAGGFAHELGVDELPFWKVIVDHPAYDGFWQSQALDKLIVKQPLSVPTMWEQGLWDQEDMWGANHSYRALKTINTPDAMNHIVMGPWFHSQVNRAGRNIGPLVWATDTTAWWRQNILLPFFNQYLKPGSPKADTPNALIYDTGLDKWDSYKTFPQACESGCPVATKPLYLSAGGSLSFDAPAAGAEKFSEYVSDPAKPVPYLPRPVTQAGWQTWLVTDQRFVDGRPDVLTWETAPLTQPLKLAGEPMVHLIASTTGTDADWVVKIIDVQPESDVPPSRAMSGYELPLATDIFRGRYRTSFEHPQAITPNVPLPYVFALPMINHTFEPGHRIMVQVQSTLFPLYDRNPQTYVPNIFLAKPSDFQKATDRVWHTPDHASYVSLPVVPAANH